MALFRFPSRDSRGAKVQVLKPGSTIRVKPGEGFFVNIKPTPTPDPYAWHDIAELIG